MVDNTLLQYDNEGEEQDGGGVRGISSLKGGLWVKEKLKKSECY